MPASFIGELILQPMAELVLQVAGYLTGWVVVPVFSFGKAYVEPAPKGVRIVPTWGSLDRDSRGKIVLSADLGAVVGLVFWACVGVGVYVACNGSAA
jgi:hypothetical protein